MSDRRIQKTRVEGVEVGASHQTDLMLLGATFSALDMAVLERLPSGTFRLIGDEPAWLSDLLGIPSAKLQDLDLSGRLYLLDHFLEEADSFWSEAKGAELASGVWHEVGRDNEAYSLEARALLVRSRSILLLEDLSRTYAERQQLYQKARDNLLSLQQLNKEIQDKEILLHCIVHDLAGPLMGIESCLSWLSREGLSEKGVRRLTIGKKATGKLQKLIRDILEVFTAESAERSVTDADAAPDALQCALGVIETLQPAASLRNVRMETELSPATLKQWRVVGERTRLERVFYNLLENAIRHSPGQGLVLIRFNKMKDGVKIAIEDEGPGVPEGAQAGLFKKFFRADTSGKAGLGLYFCRIVVERWGGEIGYMRRSPSGSRFWLELPDAI